MKNIFLLPASQPSRLCIDGKNHLHIYITSDKEIKEDNYCLFGFNLENEFKGGEGYEITESDIIKCIGFSDSGFLLHKGGDTGKENCKKIILTNDENLIKDGVQAIDEEFLEWYVKNPSCEEVRTEDCVTGSGFTYTGKMPSKKETLRGCYDNGEQISGKWEDCYKYKIIIPTEQRTDFDLLKQEAIEEEMIEFDKQKTQGYICPQTKKQCDDECCINAENCHIKASKKILDDNDFSRKCIIRF